MLVGYSALMVTSTAPLIDPENNYPSPDYQVGRAWVDVWARLQESTDALDGRVLADEIAPVHDLVPATIVGVLSRAATAGLLTKEGRTVLTGRGTRVRTFYRIKAASDV